MKPIKQKQIENLVIDLAGKQPLNLNLTAISGLIGSGLLRSINNVWSFDTNTYLTTNDIVGVATQDWVNGNFVKKTGDLITGQISLFSANGSPLRIRGNDQTQNYTEYQKYNGLTDIGYIGADGGSAVGGGVGDNFAVRATGALILHSDQGIITSNSEIQATSFRVKQTAGTGAGISLYDGNSHNPEYGLMFATTANYGTMGSVIGDFATYFTMVGLTNRGWIYRANGINVASIDGDGQINTLYHGNSYQWNQAYINSSKVAWQDNRIIAPSEVAPTQIKYGFASYNNNNTGPWADFLHINGYVDSSGGNSNLIVIKKDGFGLRIYQGEFQSDDAYSNYTEIFGTHNFDPTLKANTSGSNIINTANWRNNLDVYSKSDIDNFTVKYGAIGSANNPVRFGWDGSDMLTQVDNVIVGKIAFKDWTDSNYAKQSGYYSGLSVGYADDSFKWNGEYYNQGNITSPISFMTNNGTGWGYTTTAQMQSILGINTSWNLQQVVQNGGTSTLPITVQGTTFEDNSIKLDTDLYVLTQGNGAQRIATGGILASGDYADINLIPANGIYSKGTIATGSHGNSAQWNEAYNKVQNAFEKESIISSLNVNSLELGLFTVLPTTLNLPVTTYGIVYCYKANTTWWFQQFKDTSGNIWERRAINPGNVDDWQPWVKTNGNSSIDNYVQNWDVAGAIGFLGSDVNRPYFYHNTSGNFVEIAPKDWVINNFASNTALGNYVNRAGDTMSGALLFDGQTNPPALNKTGVYSMISSYAGGGNNPVTTLTTGLVDHIGIEKVGHWYKKLIFGGNDGDIYFPNGNYTVASETWVNNNFVSNTALGNYVNRAGDTMSGRLGIKPGPLGNNVSLLSSVLRVLNNDQGIFMGSFNGTPDYGSWIQSTREAFDIPFNLYLNPNGGNVGIGTTNPQAKLHVNGNAIVSDATQSNHAVNLGQLANYLPLAGGTMSGDIFFPNNRGLAHQGLRKLEFEDSATILGAGNNGTIYLRPNGNAIGIAQVYIDSGGVVNTTNGNGTSANWHTAFTKGFINHGFLGNYYSDYNDAIMEGRYIMWSDATQLSMGNRPSNYSGVLEVTWSDIVNGVGTWCFQRYQEYGGEQFTYTRRYYNGAWSAWKNITLPDLSNYVDKTTQNQNITSHKIFNSGSSNYWDTGIEIRGNGSTIFPSIGFHQPGVKGSTLQMRNDHLLYWDNQILATRNWVNDNAFIKSGNWQASLVPGNREFGIISNDGTGEMVFKYGAGVLNVAIDGEYYATDNQHKVYHRGDFDINNYVTTVNLNNKANTNGNNVTADSIWNMYSKGIYSGMPGNSASDYFRIIGLDEGGDMGAMEIATADNGDEPIYVRQYSYVGGSGTGINTGFNSIVRSATLLGRDGNTHFPQHINAGYGFTVKQTNGGGNGISLYGENNSVNPSYGLMFATTANYGTMGSVSGDWATYFTMDGAGNRGWIFRAAGTNVASIDGNGYISTYHHGTSADWNRASKRANDQLSATKTFYHYDGVGQQQTIRLVIDLNAGGIGGTFKVTITGSYHNANSHGRIEMDFSVLTNSSVIHVQESKCAQAFGPLLDNFYIDPSIELISSRWLVFNIHKKSSAINPVTIKVEHTTSDNNIDAWNTLNRFYVEKAPYIGNNNFYNLPEAGILWGLGRNISQWGEVEHSSSDRSGFFAVNNGTNIGLPYTFGSLLRFRKNTNEFIEIAGDVTASTLMFRNQASGWQKLVTESNLESYNHRLYYTNEGVKQYLGAQYAWYGGSPAVSDFKPGTLALAMGNGITPQGHWNDILWLSSYTGSDVPLSTAIVSSKGDHRIGYSKQNWNAGNFGQFYEFITEQNIGTGLDWDGNKLNVIGGGAGVLSIAPQYNPSIQLTGNVLLGVSGNAGIGVTPGSNLITINVPHYTGGTGIGQSGNQFFQSITTAGSGGVVTGITQTSNGFQVTYGASTSYTLPVATQSTLGGVKDGNGVFIAADGTLQMIVNSAGSGSVVVAITQTTTGIQYTMGNINVGVTSISLNLVNVEGISNTGSSTITSAGTFALTFDAGYSLVKPVDRTLLNKLTRQSLTQNYTNSSTSAQTLNANVANHRIYRSLSGCQKMLLHLSPQDGDRITIHGYQFGDLSIRANASSSYQSIYTWEGSSAVTNFYMIASCVTMANTTCTLVYRVSLTAWVVEAMHY